MSKILFISLLPVVIAQNVPYAWPYVNTNINSGQFYLTNPDSGPFETSNRDTQHAAGNFNGYGQYGQYSGHNEEQYQDGHNRHFVNNGEEIRNSEFPLTNARKTDTRDESNVNREVNSGRKYHRIIINRKKMHSRPSDEQGVSNANLDSQKDDHQVLQATVRTNQNSGDNSYIHRSTSNVELTTVPAILAMSVPLKTNPNTHSRFADTERANDNGEGRDNSGGLIFSVDTEHSTSDKATTDNEVRPSQNDTDKNGDRWIWGEVTTTTIKTDLDDRTGLNGDGCPSGEAKVKNTCVKTH